MDDFATNNMPPDAIAIVGMSGRFPKAASVSELWDRLRNGVECISAYADDALRRAGVPEKILTDPNYVKAGASIENPADFDAELFGFNPREAAVTDPQQRVFLECCHEALEDAGCDPDRFKGAIGVFASATVSTYWHNNLMHGPSLQPVGDLQSLIGNDKDFLTTRVSYKLNLKGPSVNVQTACSSSLVAVHMACQSLLEGACDVALAGGVSVRFPSKMGYLYHPEGILSPDGHCRPFDIGAAGAVPGEGCGVVVLKRLEDAIENGDEIDSIVIGSATNNDGSLKVGFTAPSVEGQSEVIVAAQSMAGVDGDTITCIEAHGTGTRLGDPIEIRALTRAFRMTTSRNAFCALGSIKSNLGHLDAAAGVAGLIKAALQLKNRQIVPTLHFHAPNPELGLEESPFFVNAQLREWRSDHPLRAGVSSFGIGGTNAHVVLQEPPQARAGGPSRSWHLLTVSAKSETALEAATSRLRQRLEAEPTLPLADVAYTLNVGRRELPVRWSAVCRGAGDAVDLLGSFAKPAVTSAGGASVVFLFPGQGVQHPGMGEALYESEQVFREAIDRCSEMARPHLGGDLREALFPPDPRSDAAQSRIAQAELSQPCMFAVEHALAKLWMSWGVRPAAMLGHSSGEYVAAVIAGAISLEDGLGLVIERGRLIQSAPEGGMTAVGLPEEKVLALKGPSLSLAVVNGPSQCVVAGPYSDLEAFERRLDSEAVTWRRLNVTRPYHSAGLDPILAPFQEYAGRVRMASPQIPFISNASGTWFTRQDASDESYWTRHLRQTARFAEGVAEALRLSGAVFLELGPGRSVSGFIEQRADLPSSFEVISSLPHPREEKSALAVALVGLGRLWSKGAPVDWRSFYSGQRRRRVHLPTYPFERQTYRVEPSTSPEDRIGPSDGAGETPIEDWLYTQVWKQAPEAAPSLGERAIQAGSHWLVFASDGGFSDALTASLRDQGGVVFVVRSGSVFADPGDGEYAVHPTRAEDYRKLLDTVEAQTTEPIHVVHAWLAEDAILSAPDEEDAVQQLGFYSLVCLAQAFASRPSNRVRQIGIVTSGMCRITSARDLHPETATVIGACKAIPHEFPGIRCRILDIEPGTPPAARVHQVLREAARSSEEPLAAYRDGQRWTPGIERIARAEATDPSLLRELGVYLITGGLGGVALELASELAKRCRARLVLTSRSKFPPRQEWAGWISRHGHTDPTAQTIQRLLDFERHGASVQVKQADVTDLPAMSAIFREVAETFGEINGVVHAAGLPGGGMIAARNLADLAATLAPKVHGTLVLDRLLRGSSADFLMLCSSLISLIGGLGHADYCAANAFLDAFAHSRRGAPGPRVISVNWNAWRNLGMAARIDLPQGLSAWRETVQRTGIDSDEGRELFRRILASGLSHVAVSKEDLARQVRENYALSPQTSGAERAGAPDLHPRPKLSVAYVAAHSQTERSLVTIWQDSLGIREIGVNDNFFSLGGHSLLAGEIIARIHRDCGPLISMRAFFEAPTIEELTKVIEERLARDEEDARRRLAEMIANLDEAAIDAELEAHLGADRPV
jgi:acyl transferase domain-containing protein